LPLAAKASSAVATTRLRPLACGRPSGSRPQASPPVRLPGPTVVASCVECRRCSGTFHATLCRRDRCLGGDPSVRGPGGSHRFRKRFLDGDIQAGTQHHRTRCAGAAEASGRARPRHPRHRSTYLLNDPLPPARQCCQGFAPISFPASRVRVDESARGRARQCPGPQRGKRSAAAWAALVCSVGRGRTPSAALQRSDLRRHGVHLPCETPGGR